MLHAAQGSHGNQGWQKYVGKMVAISQCDIADGFASKLCQCISPKFPGKSLSLAAHPMFRNQLKQRNWLKMICFKVFYLLLLFSSSSTAQGPISQNFFGAK
jgi:hypothetical protein